MMTGILLNTNLAWVYPIRDISVGEPDIEDMVREIYCTKNKTPFPTSETEFYMNAFCEKAYIIETASVSA